VANILSGKSDASKAAAASAAKPATQQSKAGQAVVKGKSKPMGRGMFLSIFCPLTQ
jgi:hypothetical protein